MFAMRWLMLGLLIGCASLLCAPLPLLADARLVAAPELTVGASLGDQNPCNGEGCSHATIADLVIPFGYPLENHFVHAADGFVLHLHRIPYGANGYRTSEIHGGSTGGKASDKGRRPATGASLGSLTEPGHRPDQGSANAQDAVTTQESESRQANEDNDGPGANQGSGAVQSSGAGPASEHLSDVAATRRLNLVKAAGSRINAAPGASMHTPDAEGSAAAPVNEALKAQDSADDRSQGKKEAGGQEAQATISKEDLGRARQDVLMGEPTARPAVLLHHGLLDSAAGFLVLGPGHALALLLADAGYDVWLTNARGNGYSRRNTKLDIDTPEYWAFSFDEIAQYDLPAQLSYIRSITGHNTTAYVGFSQGSTVALAALAAQPELNARLSALVLLAPTTFLKHAESPPLALLSKLDNAHIFQLLGDKEFLPSEILVEIMGGPLCLMRPHLCINILAAVAGFNDQAINSTKLPRFLRYTPSGTSVQNMAHWAQLFRPNARPPTLSHFDWGSDCVWPRRGGKTPVCNLIKYGTLTVPSYRLDRVAVPIMLATGGQDQLASPPDMAALKRALAPGALRAALHLPDYQHLDFIWADSAARRVYSKVIDFLNSQGQTLGVGPGGA